LPDHDLGGKAALLSAPTQLHPPALALEPDERRAEFALGLAATAWKERSTSATWRLATRRQVSRSWGMSKVLIALALSLEQVLV
jgi:hypothetical protein